MTFETLLKSGRRIVAPLAGFPAVRITGTTIKDNLNDASLQTKSLLELHRRIKSDVVFIMMDLTVEAEALGAAIQMPDDDNPAVTEHLVKNAQDAAKVKPPSSLSGRMEVFTETVRLLKKAGAQTVAAYSIGPFTLASELIGAENAALMTITDPGTVKALLDISVETVKLYAKSLEAAGADILVILEPNSVYLSGGKFDEFSSPYVKRIISSMAAPAVLHVCGDSSHLIKCMAETGAAGLSLDADVDLTWAVRQVGPEVAIIGNISPNLMLEGDREEVYSACSRLLDSMRGHRNFILSSGCDLPVDTPVRNIIAMAEAASESR